MRALRVLGIAENGTQVVCQPVPDEENAPVAAVETFALPVDERLRAAVRGDLTRIGQLEIEMESQLRPKEIQQRIRAGSSVEQVAAAAGCSPERIERYAYPVLLERTTIAERARRAHPVTDGAVASRSVEDVVGATLAARGQQATITWDAFRDERGWALRAAWRAGRSENRATWSYHAGPSGGTVIARDEAAAMLVDPAPRPLRTVGVDDPGTDAATSPAATSGTNRSSREAALQAARTAGRATPAAGQTARRPGPGKPVPDGTPGEGVAVADPEGRASHVSPRTDHGPAASGAPSVPPDDPQQDVLEGQRRLVADTVADARSGSRTGRSADATRSAAATALDPGDVPGRARDTGTDGRVAQPGPVTHPASPARPKRGQRPQMPSWEDVLLGTRTGR